MSKSIKVVFNFLSYFSLHQYFYYLSKAVNELVQLNDERIFTSRMQLKSNNSRQSLSDISLIGREKVKIVKLLLSDVLKSTEHITM